MTYDEAIQKAEKIVQGLESSEPISVTEYKKQAAEAGALLDYCEQQILNLNL